MTIKTTRAYPVLRGQTFEGMFSGSYMDTEYGSYKAEMGFSCHEPATISFDDEGWGFITTKY